MYSVNLSAKPFTKTSSLLNMSREILHTKCLLPPFTHLVESDNYGWRCKRFPLLERCSDPSIANNGLRGIINPFALISIWNKSVANVIFHWLHARLSFILCYVPNVGQFHLHFCGLNPKPLQEYRRLLELNHYTIFSQISGENNFRCKILLKCFSFCPDNCVPDKSVYVTWII